MKNPAATRNTNPRANGTTHRDDKVDDASDGRPTGSLVAVPHRQQMSALSAIAVPQCVQIIDSGVEDESGQLVAVFLRISRDACASSISNDSSAA